MGKGNENELMRMERNGNVASNSHTSVVYSSVLHGRPSGKRF